MASQKTKWLVITAAVACIGCCAIPLYLVLASVSGVGVLVTLISKQSIDAFLCLIPLVLIAGYFLFTRKRIKKECCSAPTTECSNKQCGNNIFDVGESK